HNRYGHLEEVVVKRAYQKLYKFKEGDFVDPHLNGIEDMLILAVQHKLFQLNDSDIVDFIMALVVVLVRWLGVAAEPRGGGGGAQLVETKVVVSLDEDGDGGWWCGARFGDGDRVAVMLLVAMAMVSSTVGVKEMVA
nr:hypothetical protein [Tanacetum cinerariifolium]